MEKVKDVPNCSWGVPGAVTVYDAERTDVPVDVTSAI
jgi:hypothetical protein